MCPAVTFDTFDKEYLANVCRSLAVFSFVQLKNCYPRFVSVQMDTLNDFLHGAPPMPRSSLLIARTKTPTTRSRPALSPEAELDLQSRIEDVYRQCGTRVYSLARRMLDNDADAEDVAQDVLLQVVRGLDNFRGESTIMTWLYRVTVNAALALRRKRAAVRDC